MKLIIAGSRHLDSDDVYKAIITYMLDSNISNVEEIVSGGCRGVDKAGEIFAALFNIKLTIFEAKWNKLGKSAGPRRNRFMAEYADALLLIWDGKSSGSKNMKEEMVRLNKPIHEIIISPTKYDMEL